MEGKRQHRMKTMSVVGPSLDAVKLASPKAFGSSNTRTARGRPRREWGGSTSRRLDHLLELPGLGGIAQFAIAPFIPKHTLRPLSAALTTNLQVEGFDPRVDPLPRRKD